MTIKTLVGKERIFTGDTAKEVVYAMMKEDFLAVAKTEYMLDVKDRVELMWGFVIEVTPGDYAGFLSELESCGLIRTETVN